MVRYFAMVLCIVSLPWCAAAIASAAPAGAYYVTDIGNLGIGGTAVEGLAVARVGGQPMMAGYDFGSGIDTEQAFAWTPSGGIVNLQSVIAAKYGPVAYSMATGVNSSGQLVGYYTDNGEGVHGFIYTGGTNITNIDNYATNGVSADIQNVGGINSSGVIGGSYTNGLLPAVNGFIADTHAQTFTGIGAYGDPGGTSYAFAINNNGWLAGYGNLTSGGSGMVEWRGASTGWVLLPSINSANSSYGEAIDSNGDAVGYALAPSNTPVYYNYATNTTVALPYASGHTGGKAFGINDNGVVVGMSNSAAFVQSVAGGTPGPMEILNNLIAAGTGWNLQYAYAVDNAGDIVGRGTLNGTADAFLLEPALPGDANLDAKVDINDLTIVLANYGKTGMTWTQGEFTGDGTVDINDLTIVLANYGASAGASAGGDLAAVPEPGALGLAASGLVALLACARRKRT